MRLIVLLATLMLGACSLTLQRADVPPPSASGIREREISNCPVYTPPPARTVPPTPAEEYSKIPREKTEARVELLLDYIQTLREHIRAAKTDHLEQYSNYLRSCVSKEK